MLNEDYTATSEDVHDEAPSALAFALATASIQCLRCGVEMTSAGPDCLCGSCRRESEDEHFGAPCYHCGGAGCQACDMTGEVWR